MIDTAPPFDTTRVNVLMVDDQAMVSEAVRRMLASEQDIDFHSVTDPAKALPEALALSPTVVLVDLVMPDIDGLTLVRYFRAHPKLKELPLIVLSTKEEPLTKAQAFASGANDYLVKLPDRLELAARLRYHSRGYTHLLERNRAYQELARQLDQAAQYVRNLLPKPITSGPVQADWVFEPSAQLGGDALGYHWIDQERFAFYLLDVCDHGVGPALLSVSALNVLRSQTLPGVDFTQPAQVMAGLNSVFQMSNQNDLYFTIFYGVCDLTSRTLRFASAGHPPPLLFGRDGSVTELRCQSVFVGAMPGAPFKQQETSLENAASILVFSDGAYELRGPDGRMGGYEEFRDLCHQRWGASGPDLDALVAHARAVRGRAILDDDLSALALRFTPA